MNLCFLQIHAALTGVTARPLLDKVAPLAGAAAQLRAPVGEMLGNR